MKLRSSLAVLGAAVALAGAASPAAAQIYKYKKPDGTVVYTDKLSDLPKERRAYYNRKAEEAEQKRQEALARLTPEQRRAAELEAQRKKLMAEELEETERQQRLQAIEKALAEFRESEKALAQEEALWQQKKAEAEKRLAEALAAYRAARKEYEELATRVRYTLFPGQQARLVELEKALPELEAEVDAANTYLTETLPEEAREAGALPGWIR